MSGSESPDPAPRPDLRTLPLAVVAVIAAVTATGAQGGVMTAMVPAALVACLLTAWKRRWAVCAAAAVLAVVAVTAWARVERLHDSAIATLATDRAAVTVTGRVASDPRILSARGSRPAGVLVDLVADQVQARGLRVTQPAAILVTASGATRAASARLPVGARVEVAGVLAPSERSDPTAAVLRLRSVPRILSGPGTLDRGVNRIREALVASVRHNGAGQRALVPSLVVGDTSAVGERMDEEFRATALTHLMAVSGANLASTTALLWWVGSWLGLRRRPLRALSVVGVAGFVIVCRSEPSVVRAAAMGVVTLAAAGLSFDRAAGLRALCVAVMSLMLVDPWLCRSVGFWLSVCATTGILWWTTPWARAMSSWLPENAARALVVPWAAQLATQPVVTWISGRYLQNRPVERVRARLWGLLVSQCVSHGVVEGRSAPDPGLATASGSGLAGSRRGGLPVMSSVIASQRHQSATGEGPETFLPNRVAHEPQPGLVLAMSAEPTTTRGSGDRPPH